MKIVTSGDKQRKKDYPFDPQNGLVLPAISGRIYALNNNSPHARLTIYSDIAECTIIRTPSEKSPSKKPGTKRPITAFSRKSRKTMFRTMGKIRNLHASVFITLTYPGLFDDTPERVKRDFQAFKKRFFRKYEGAGMVWRLELKQRLSGASEGRIAPHFHLLVMLRNTGKFKDLIANVRKAWHEVVVSKENRWTPEALDHFKAGTSVEKMKSRKQAISYVSKYIGKVEQIEMEAQELQLWGRHWGISGELDLQPQAYAEIDRAQFVHIRRLIASAMKARERRIKRDKQGNPIKKKRGFSRRFRNGGTMKSFAALGFGDQSNPHKTFKTSLIWRFIKSMAMELPEIEIRRLRRANLAEIDRIARLLTLPQIIPNGKA